MNRSVPMTPAEIDMVKDFNSLRESVNMLRGPLGATGFRGPEAFHALQAQRGQLLARPELTKGILETFVNEVQAQKAPIEKVLHPNAVPPVTNGAASDLVQKLINKHKAQ